MKKLILILLASLLMGCAASTLQQAQELGADRLHVMCTINWGLVTGISSAVIALCALVFSICQGMQARKHNRLSVRPDLTTWEEKDAEKGFYGVELINNGIGPAVIEEFSVKVDGKLVSGDGSEPIVKAMKIVLPNLQYQSQQSYLGKGYVMAPKEQRTVFAVQFLGHPLPSMEFVEHAIKRCNLEITYKSFYGEKFRFPRQKEK